MKEYKLKKELFIGGWFIPEKICDGLVEYYNENKEHIVEGKIGAGAENRIEKKIKESKDLTIDNFECAKDNRLLEYNNYMQKVINLYSKKYPEVNNLQRFVIKNYNIQKYKKNGGFKKWHFERSAVNISSRVLVFMTYLNTIKNGGTKFKYQKLITPAVKGLTLIWPTDITHTHKSQICNKEKIIATGWMEFL